MVNELESSFNTCVFGFGFHRLNLPLLNHHQKHEFIVHQQGFFNKVEQVKKENGIGFIRVVGTG